MEQPSCDEYEHTRWRQDQVATPVAEIERVDVQRSSISHTDLEVQVQSFSWQVDDADSHWQLRCVSAEQALSVV